MSNPPILHDEQERINSILNDTPAIFDIITSSTASPIWGEWRTVNAWGINAVSQYNSIIEQEALAQGVDPDWVRAIIYLENAQDIQDSLTPDFLEDGKPPMNLHPDVWGNLLPAGSDFSDPQTNIKAGVTLIKRITDRLLPEDQNLDKVASIYNFTGQQIVVDYGARANNILDNELWNNPSEYNYQNWESFKQSIGDTTLDAVDNIQDLVSSLGTSFLKETALITSYYGDLKTALVSSLGSEKINDDKDYYNFSSNSFNKAFESLGVDTSLDFSLDGWSVIGAENSIFNDFTYSFGSGDFTLFSSTDRIKLPNLGSDLWDFDLNYNINTQISSVWDNLFNAQNHVSPLTLDLDGDGIESNHIYSQNVFFDIDADGFAERVGWVSTNDGMIAMDNNGNGEIDNITELFGDDEMPAFQKFALEVANDNYVSVEVKRYA